MALHALNLCDGYGGFSLALAGFGVRTVARVERDAYAAAVLVERMAQARLDSCPVWDDLTTFDGSAWGGCVDVITAGFPCQPFSAAGSRLGLDDERWLWPAIERIVRDVEPSYVILENVGGVVRAGLAEVLHDLAQLGFDAEWGLLAAADVGAPHRRERFWLVAHADRDGLPEVAHRADEAMADSDDHRLQIGVGGRHETSCSWPPLRDDLDGWAGWIAQGGPQPVLRRDADGPPNGLADALHLGGNGLVPQAAAEAIRQLLDRGGWVLR